MKDLPSLLKETDLKALIAAITATLAFLIGIVNAFISFFNNRANIVAKRKDERRKEIYTALNEFYAPLQQYLNLSKSLYKIFTIGKPKELRTLTYLLDRNQIYQFDDGSKGNVTLNNTDNELLKQIFEVGEKIEDLIINKAGLVDDPELRLTYKPDRKVTDITSNDNSLLAITLTHLQVIRLAFQGKLNDVNRFKDYVFPRELPIKLEQNIQKLRNELKTVSG